MDRRNFLKTTVVAGTAAFACTKVRAADPGPDGPVHSSLLSSFAVAAPLTSKRTLVPKGVVASQ